MAARAQCAAPGSRRYQRRRPARTPWYRIVQNHLCGPMPIYLAVAAACAVRASGQNGPMIGPLPAIVVRRSTRR